MDNYSSSSNEETRLVLHVHGHKLPILEMLSGLEKTIFCGGKNSPNQVSFKMFNFIIKVVQCWREQRGIKNQTYCELC